MLRSLSAIRAGRWSIAVMQGKLAGGAGERKKNAQKMRTIVRKALMGRGKKIERFEKSEKSMFWVCYCKGFAIRLHSLSL